MAKNTKSQHWAISTLKQVFQSPITVIVAVAGIIMFLSTFNSRFAGEFFTSLLVIGGGVVFALSGLTYGIHYLVSKSREKSGAPALPETGIQWLGRVWGGIFHNSATTFIFLSVLIGLMIKYNSQIGFEAGVALGQFINQFLAPLLILGFCIGLFIYGIRVMLGMSKFPPGGH